MCYLLGLFRLWLHEQLQAGLTRGCFKMVCDVQDNIKGELKRRGSSLLFSKSAMFNKTSPEAFTLVIFLL